MELQPQGHNFTLLLNRNVKEVVGFEVAYCDHQLNTQCDMKHALLENHCRAVSEIHSLSLNHGEIKREVELRASLCCKETNSDERYYASNASRKHYLDNCIGTSNLPCLDDSSVPEPNLVLNFQVSRLEDE